MPDKLTIWKTKMICTSGKKRSGRIAGIQSDKKFFYFYLVKSIAERVFKA